MNSSGQTGLATDDLGFSFRINKSGELSIMRSGRQVTILRGNRASQVVLQLEDLSFRDQQLLLARLTGNYKRGNEKPSRH